VVEYWSIGVLEWWSGGVVEEEVCWLKELFTNSSVESAVNAAEIVKRKRGRFQTLVRCLGTALSNRADFQKSFQANSIALKFCNS
jgi:hypothetical protein